MLCCLNVSEKRSHAMLKSAYTNKQPTTPRSRYKLHTEIVKTWFLPQIFIHCNTQRLWIYCTVPANKVCETSARKIHFSYVDLNTRGPCHIERRRPGIRAGSSRWTSAPFDRCQESNMLFDKSPSYGCQSYWSSFKPVGQEEVISSQLRKGRHAYTVVCNVDGWLDDRYR